MVEVAKKHPQVGSVIVGSGAEKENIFKKIKNCNLENNIKLESWTDDLASYYKSADLSKKSLNVTKNCHPRCWRSVR